MYSHELNHNSFSLFYSCSNKQVFSNCPSDKKSEPLGQVQMEPLIKLNSCG
jgi:hypothetical protein